MTGQGGSQLDLFDGLSLDTPSLQVYGIIRHHKGRANAISVGAIATHTGIGERTVRSIVKHLIEDHRVRIGSALGRPSGYYIIETLEETEQNERTLRSLAISTLRHAAVLRQVSLSDYLSGIQGELFV